MRQSDLERFYIFVRGTDVVSPSHQVSPKKRITYAGDHRMKDHQNPTKSKREQCSGPDVIQNRSTSKWHAHLDVEIVLYGSRV